MAGWPVVAGKPLREKQPFGRRVGAAAVHGKGGLDQRAGAEHEISMAAIGVVTEKVFSELFSA
jgi:hypothetical protein